MAKKKVPLDLGGFNWEAPDDGGPKGSSPDDDPFSKVFAPTNPRPRPTPIAVPPGDMDAGKWMDAEAENARARQLMGMRPSPTTGTYTAEMAARDREYIEEFARRQFEAMKVFEALKTQEPFFASRAHRRLLIGSNRAGKTLVAAMEIARAFCNQDPYHKYPEKDGRIIVCAQKLIHCGKVLWRKLANKGQMRMIRDPETGTFRAFRPFAEWDQKNKQLRVNAEPLIPGRYIADISWDSKKDRIPKTVYGTTGWEMSFFSSEMDPPNGWDVDIVWFDEEIENGEWLPEAMARLTDRNGVFIWSATPQHATVELLGLHEEADRQALQVELALSDGRPAPRRTCVEFTLLLDDNPHVDEEGKQAFSDSLTDEQREVRIGGVYAISQRKVYGEFRRSCSPGNHGVVAFEVPWDWTIYVTVDPGVKITAALFAALPPDARRLYLYDELYIPNCDARKFAHALKQKMDVRVAQDYIIDRRYGRARNPGTGKTTHDHYAEEMEKIGILSHYRKFGGFTLADDDIEGGITAVKRGLATDHTGEPYVKCVIDHMPMFWHEITRYAMKRDPKTGLMVHPDSGKYHLMDCFRYMMAYEPRYVAPPPSVMPINPAYAAYLKKQQKKRLQGHGHSISLG